MDCEVCGEPLSEEELEAGGDLDFPICFECAGVSASGGSGSVNSEECAECGALLTDDELDHGMFVCVDCA